jgi:hypothetical protein
MIGFAALTLGASTLAGPVSAITDGTRDDANEYSNVGILLNYSPFGDSLGRFRCTGTLISPTVMLTAAHCTFGSEGKTIVSFDPVIAEAPPSNIPRAEDDPGDGTSTSGYTGAEDVSGDTRNWIFGDAFTAPGYSNFTDLANWNDYAVIVFDEPVDGIQPAELAPVGYLEGFRQPNLNKTVVTSVGYGTEVRKAESGPQLPTPMSYPLVRRIAHAPGQKLSPQILQTNGNGNDTRGTGGTCFGDSGGPSFLDGYLVTVTSYGYTSNCRYLDGLQRVDIQVAQDWLEAFLD